MKKARMIELLKEMEHALSDIAERAESDGYNNIAASNRAEASAYRTVARMLEDPEYAADLERIHLTNKGR